MSKTMQILVSGKVQGVGFRNFVANHAEALGVRGWVRNLRDSRVEILAELDGDQLNELRSQIEKGPQFSVVESVIVNEVAATLEGDDFSIAADGGEAWSQN